MFHFDLKRFSTNRTQIMGVSMLCVVFFHSGFDLNDVPILSIFKQWGDIGVDMFLLMSGMGIYHSLSKKPDTSAYIRSRFRRILPAHLVVCGCWFFLLDIVLYREGLLAFLMDVTSLNFWINGRLTTWYLSSLLVMQVLTPIYLKIWKRYPRFDWLCIPVVYMLCGIITYTPEWNSALEHLLVFFYRIPAYLVGLSIGRRICNQRSEVSASVPIVGFALALSILVLSISSGLTPFYLRWVLRYAAYLPLALMLCVAVSRIPESRILTFWGTRSLEIYLLHEKVLWVLSVISGRIFSDRVDCSFIINVLAILISCFCAQILHNLISHLIRRKEA